MKETRCESFIETVRANEGGHTFYYLEIPNAFWGFSGRKQRSFGFEAAKWVKDFLKRENVQSSLRHDPRFFICSDERCIVEGFPDKTRYPSPERCRPLWENCKPLLRVLSWAAFAVPGEGNDGRGCGWCEVYAQAFGDPISGGGFMVSKSTLEVARELFPEDEQVFERLGVPIWIPTESEFATSQALSPQEVAKGYKQFLLQQAGLQAEIERKGGVATRVFYTDEQVLSKQFAYNMAVEAGWDGWLWVRSFYP